MSSISGPKSIKMFAADRGEGTHTFAKIKPKLKISKEIK